MLFRSKALSFDSPVASAPGSLRMTEGKGASGAIQAGEPVPQGQGWPQARAAVPQARGGGGAVPQTPSQMTKSGQSDTLSMFSHHVCEWLDRYCCSPESGVSTRGGDRAEPLLLDLVRTGIENDFERVVFPQFPELRDVKCAMEDAGAKYASLSGSGSTVYGLFASKAAAVKAAARLQAKGTPAVATRTLTRARYWKEM